MSLIDNIVVLLKRLEYNFSTIFLIFVRDRDGNVYVVPIRNLIEDILLNTTNEKIQCKHILRPLNCIMKYRAF